MERTNDWAFGNYSTPTHPTCLLQRDTGALRPTRLSVRLHYSSIALPGPFPRRLEHPAPGYGARAVRAQNMAYDG